MITEPVMQGEVEAALDEWFDGSFVEFDETTYGLGVRQHRVEKLTNGTWRTYPADDVNAKRYWEITVLVREVRE
jgi:hypothetical protein